MNFSFFSFFYVFSVADLVDPSWSFPDEVVVCAKLGGVIFSCAVVSAYIQGRVCVVSDDA